MEEVPRRTSLAPLASLCLVCCQKRGGSRRAFRFPGEGGDHFHCTVEPSPGHMRCRKKTHKKQPRNPFLGWDSLARHWGPLRFEVAKRVRNDFLDPLATLVAGALRGNTIRGNTTRNSERKMAL